MSNLAVDVLLGCGIGAQLLCCLGLVAMRRASDRLHYASAGYTVGPFFVLAAILVREQLSMIGFEALAATALIFVPGPVLVHATGRVIARLERADEGSLPRAHL